MTNKTKDLITKLKEDGQDNEFYPTTNEIIQALYKDLLIDRRSASRRIGHFSLMDIGAGNGKVLNKIKEFNNINLNKDYKDSYAKRQYEGFGFTSYAIEKSQILLDSLDKDIIVVGTDFYQQSLLDKEVDYIFSNPPYTEFSEWSQKIIKEATSQVIYLVIPKRWSIDKGIQQALELREAKAEILGEFSFESSEDRQARAYVNLIKVELKQAYYNDPFAIWFDEHFKIDADKTSPYKSDSDNVTKDRLQGLVSDKNYVFNIVEFFNKDMNSLLGNYKALESISGDLLKELGVNKKSLIEGLKLKIQGLKTVYWNELFGKLKTITSRLTDKSRSALLSKLTKQTNIDFTESNIYSVVIWVIKNSNDYFDKQLLEVYSSLTTQENIRLYKSNSRIIEDGWRFHSSNMTHYSLDYRIIAHRSNTIGGSKWESEKGLHNHARTMIQDIFTIANNLGFDVPTLNEQDSEWVAGKRQEFVYGKDKVLFCDIKAHKNGNIHFRFLPEFMKKLNIEAARLNKWIKSPKEACNEFDISEEEANDYFKCNLVIPNSNNVLLLK